jgi:hypothetical protein
MGPKNSRLQLSSTQLIASVLAAITATVAGSFLGVNGTIMGAAIASLVTVVGNAVYAHSIHRTRERVSTVAPAMRWMTPATLPSASSTTAVLPRVEPEPAAPIRGGWRRVGLAAAGVFAALLTLLTTVEVVSGRPLSDLLRGKSGSGTTVFGSGQGRSVQTPTSPVTVTQTVTPAVVTQTPTITQTAPAVTVTPTVTVPPASTGATDIIPTPTSSQTP